MAKLERYAYPMPQLGNSIKTWDQDSKRQIKELDRLYEASAKLPKGKIVGAMVKFQVADGYAHYIVTKENPLTVQYVPFMDDYLAHPALIRGLTKQDILEQLDWERTWRKACAKQKKGV